jgi:hypothetical protein
MFVSDYPGVLVSCRTKCDVAIVAVCTSNLARKTVCCRQTVIDAYLLIPFAFNTSEQLISD